jgi:hypothetical protein
MEIFSKKDFSVTGDQGDELVVTFLRQRKCGITLQDVNLRKQSAIRSRRKSERWKPNLDTTEKRATASVP